MSTQWLLVGYNTEAVTLCQVTTTQFKIGHLHISPTAAPFTNMVLFLIPAWISNHMPS